MPNYCDYSMRIIGKKEEDINEFVSYMKAQYCYQKDGDAGCEANHHFFRIFEAYEEEIEDLGTGYYSCIINGYCAWSMTVCMLDGKHSYYGTMMESIEKNPEKEAGFKGISLQEACKKLNLDVEIFSKEGGAGFMEHIICNQGILTTNECYDDYREIENEDGELVEQGGIEWDFTI